MKAILLAGGEGTRLRPISAEQPKPLARILGKPIMQYGLELLAKHGFHDVTAALRTLPQKITDRFGDGESLGIRLRYAIESVPLGTAGAVRACLKHPATDEPLVIMSGDAVTDFDLREAVRYHVSRGADATLLLSRQKELLEYGLVMTDAKGRVTRFVEKPAWDQVFCDRVNTGIYILSPRVLELVPEGVFYDFAKDLFPRMLASGMALYGMDAEGYWCDVGNARAYMNCCADLLDGKARLTLARQMSAVPHGVEVRGPCFLGEDCSVGEGTVLGPYAMLSAGTRVGRHVRIECSVLDGARVDDLSVLEGAYVGARAHLCRGAVLREGAIVGEDCVIGPFAELKGSARVWPRREIEAGSRVSAPVTGSGRVAGASYAGALLAGVPYSDVTPEFCLRLGSALSSVCGAELALSWQGGYMARTAALALEAGMCAMGGRPVLTDSLFPAVSAYAAALYRFPLSLFLRQRGDLLQFSLFDEDGLALSRETARKLETLIARGDMVPIEPDRVGHSRRLEGVAPLYVAAAAAGPDWAMNREPLHVRATGGDAASDALRRVLTAAGCQVHIGPRPDTPAFFTEDDGLSFHAEDENGQLLPHSRLLAMLLWLEAAEGADALALPYSAPAVLDEIAATLGMKLLRLGRDGSEARALYARQRFVRDALFGAARLTYGLRRHRLRLCQLVERVPPIFEKSRVIGVAGDRGAIMRELAKHHGDAELIEGFRLRAREGWVHVAPMHGRDALRVTAEAVSMEAAEELCDIFSGIAKKIDRQSGESGIQ